MRIDRRDFLSITGLGALMALFLGSSREDEGAESVAVTEYAEAYEVTDEYLPRTAFPGPRRVSAKVLLGDADLMKVWSSMDEPFTASLSVNDVYYTSEWVATEVVIDSESWGHATLECVGECLRHTDQPEGMVISSVTTLEFTNCQDGIRSDVTTYYHG